MGCSAPGRDGLWWTAVHHGRAAGQRFKLRLEAAEKPQFSMQLGEGFQVTNS